MLPAGRLIPTLRAGPPRYRTGRVGGAGGYSLAELMIGVAVLGTLATLVIQGGRRHLAAARGADAKQTVTAIARASTAAYERGGSARAFCSDSTFVPAYLAQVQARSYQPSSAMGSDFQTGSETAGWKCLGFAVSEPLYYQYSYGLDGAHDWSEQLSEPYFVARAQGDVDDDGVYSRFSRGGRVSDGLIILQTDVWSQQETE